jgi:hypothetical protein
VRRAKVLPLRHGAAIAAIVAGSSKRKHLLGKTTEGDLTIELVQLNAHSVAVQLACDQTLGQGQTDRRARRKHGPSPLSVWKGASARKEVPEMDSTKLQFARPFVKDTSQMVCWFAWFARFFLQCVSNAVLPLQLRLSPHDRMARIVLRVMFVSGSIVSNSANDFFGVVTTRQGTLCVGPVVLGLARGAALG